MIKRVPAAVCLLMVSLLWPGKALPQTPPPESLAAAKEFVVAAKMVDQMRQTTAIILQQLRPPGMQNQVGDSIAAVVTNVMNSHMETFVNEAAQIYARHFTADEIRQLTAFYRTPAGEKLLQKQPELAQELAVYLQSLYPVIDQEIRKGVEEALRKQGQKF